MDVPTLRQGSFAGKRVLVRVDYNVPIEAGKVADDARIVASVATVDHLRKAGAKVILVSHLGRPKGKPDPKASLRPVAEHMRAHLGMPVQFTTDCVGPVAMEAVGRLHDGDVLLL